MNAKSDRRRALEASLADDPTDVFLRYGLAIQCLREGAVEEGRSRLASLVHDEPEYVAAYQQLGQSYIETGESDAAREILRLGRAKAIERGEAHAAAEMGGLLEMI